MARHSDDLMRSRIVPEEARKGQAPVKDFRLSYMPTTGCLRARCELVRSNLSEPDVGNGEHLFPARWSE